MAEQKIYRYRCSSCPFRETFHGAVPQKVPGACLTPGTQYCKGGKKVRVFKPKDPKIYPPSWCPRLKKPAEYRIYAYKDPETWLLHQFLRADGSPGSPSGYEYALRAKGRTELTAPVFLSAAESKSPSDVLGTAVHVYEVLEIDNGLQSAFFHITGDGVKVLTLFSRDVALKNQYKGDGDT